MNNIDEIVSFLLNETKRAEEFKRYLHISFRNDLDNKVITPKLPNSILEYLEDLKKEPLLKNDLEETKTPRFCMADELDGCLNGVGHLLKLLNTHPSLTFYVYTNRDEINKMYDAEYLHDNKLVFDAYLTNEIWVLEPLYLVKLGKFNLTKKNLDMSKETKPVKPFNTNKIPHNNTFQYVFKDLPKFERYDI